MAPIKYKTEEEKRIGRNLRERERKEKNLEKFQNYQKEYREKNKEKIEIKRKERYLRNREDRISYSKKWILDNKDRYRKTRREYQQRRLKSDYLFKFNTIIRSLIYQSFKRVNLNKNKKGEEILGCTLDQFRTYILSLCPENTKLKDFHKFGYHIDHKIPISMAKTEEDVIRLCHYTNLQPLWWRDNIIKSNNTNL